MHVPHPLVEEVGRMAAVLRIFLLTLSRGLVTNPKDVARFLLWTVGIRRYLSFVPLFLIRGHVPTKPVIIEAGAHIGEDTAQLALHFKPTKLYAFEPVPDLFQSLKQNAESLTAVECIPQALADHCGTARLYVSAGYTKGEHPQALGKGSSGDASSSMLKPTGHLDLHPHVQFSEGMDVDVTTVDAFAQRHGLEKVDFMWLDLQGMELKALQGAESTLRTVESVYLEVSTKEMFEGATHYAELKEWMRSRGFVPKHVAIPWEGHGNALFVRAKAAASSPSRLA